MASAEIKEQRKSVQKKTVGNFDHAYFDRAN
jgi:hypothetical protein